MKYRINVKTIMVCCLFLIFYLVDSKFFYLIELPDYFAGEAQNKTLLGLLSITIFLIFIIVKKGKIDLGNFGGLILLLFAIIILSGINSITTFNYSFRQVVWPVFQFSVLLLYFPLKEIMLSEKYQNLFLIFGEITYSILSILFLVQSFFYQGISSLFLKIENMIPSSYYYNFENLRIYSVFEGTVRILILLVAYRIINKKFKKCFLDIISFSLMLLAIITIDQSRYYLIITIVSIFILYLRNKSSVISFRELFVIIIVFVLGAILLSKMSSSILDSYQENTGSSYARIGAILYYLKLVSLYHPLLGLSLSLPDGGTSAYYYVKGTQGLYNFSDIGIFGIYASLGILGFVWYCLLIYKLIKRATNNSLVIALVANIILSIPIMSFIDRPRLVSLMLLLVIFDIQISTNKYKEMVIK